MANLVKKSGDKLSTSITTLDPSLGGYLSSLGLPTDNLLASTTQRRIVISQLESAIELIEPDERRRSVYLSRFVTAAAVGLFDAAVTYLWNETVRALRKKVADFDLSYFFDVAEKRETYRQKLHTVDDLSAIEDATLVDTCARIGLLSEVNRERLRHVNYMRNHASSAHPNETEISGAELVAWLTVCVQYAIASNLEPSVLTVQRLLSNIRTHEIPSKDFGVICGEIPRLGQPRIDDLLWTVFGMYVDPGSSASTRSNIDNLATHIWNASSEDRRHEVGARYAVFAKNADIQRKSLADQFLSGVGGARYKSEDVLVAELLEKLRALRSAHNGGNNFYNEWPHAKDLESSLPISGMVPRAARLEWVRVLVQCWVGNGLGYRDGVDEAAVPHYHAHLVTFGEAEIVTLLWLMDDPDFTVDLHRSKTATRLQRLVADFKTKTNNVHILRALDVIVQSPVPGKVGPTTEYKGALASLPVH
jgi:hypothetical protein